MNDNLEQKIWYRALRVFYIIAHIPLLLFLILHLSNLESSQLGLRGLFWVVIVYISLIWLVKKAALYVILGKK